MKIKIITIICSALLFGAIFVSLYFSEGASKSEEKLPGDPVYKVVIHEQETAYI